MEVKVRANAPLTASPPLPSTLVCAASVLESHGSPFSTILYSSLQFSTVLYGCGKEYHCGSVENIKENQMRHCCARRSVLSSFLMVLFEIFDPYGEQFLETSTEKTALQLPKKQPWTRLMHKQILSIPFGNICLKNVQSVQYISVHSEEKGSSFDNGNCIGLLYNSDF